MRRIAVLMLIAATITFSPPTNSRMLAQSPAASAVPLPGHSTLGEQFDTGPRSKPVRFDDLTVVHFPITTTKPEVQEWFDQGQTLLELYWFVEAERAFRWCAKLDPDNPMPYWALSRTVTDPARRKAFLADAIKRQAHASPRERAYIQASTVLDGPDRKTPDRTGFKRALQRIILEFPEDSEAKVLYAQAVMDDAGDTLGMDAIFRQVLATNPNHPGIHHFRIHLWDNTDRRQALDSARRLSELAPSAGHGLHMPAHVYTSLGMWHEAAINLDASTRAESKYMRRLLVFPYQTWNYAHNRYYLSYVQEQLGLPELAISGADELVTVPFDPTDNNLEGFGPYEEGVQALMRAFVRFGRWSDILTPGRIPWTTTLRDRVFRGYAETLAFANLGELGRATQALERYTALRDEVKKAGRAMLTNYFELQSKELDATIALSEGENERGIAVMTQAAEAERLFRFGNNDPPYYPYTLYERLGRAYLRLHQNESAIAAFEKSLEVVPNNPYALAGLVEANVVLGRTAQAKEYYARVSLIWSEADPRVREWAALRALGLTATPIDHSPQPQRTYKHASLDRFGPANWISPAAPVLDARDGSGKATSWARYDGRNVVLLFYLGPSCVACTKQLARFDEYTAAFAQKNAVVVAVNVQEPPHSTADNGSTIQFLFDPTHANARRFMAYDDFEDIPLHSVALIDTSRKLVWATRGPEPFMDPQFVIQQLDKTGGERKVSSY